MWGLGWVIVQQCCPGAEVHDLPKASPLLQPLLRCKFNRQLFLAPSQAQADLDWTPEFDLAAGLRDSYEKDFSKTGGRKKADFSVDDLVLKGAGKQAVPA